MSENGKNKATHTNKKNKRKLFQTFIQRKEIGQFFLSYIMSERIYEIHVKISACFTLKSRLTRSQSAENEKTNKWVMHVVVLLI